MKRDLITLTLSVVLLLGVSFLGASRILPASGQPSGDSRVVLILDAGHGGEDGGATSASGDRESDINLSIVLRMEALLAFLGTETRLTREEDVSLHSDGCTTTRERKTSDLKNRVKLVNETENAVLISVHQNYFTDSRYSGAQVFYNTGDISRQWGEYTQEALRQVLDPNNGRSSKGLPNSVYLFEHISCPSILVECGFLSNGEEASLLLTASYQRKIALALAGAYLHELQMIPDRSFGGD